MRCLLDTHTFLWYIGRHPAIPSAIREIIEQPTTLRFLSIASLWEMAIKVNAGKLEIGMPFPTLVHDHVFGNGIMLLSIDSPTLFSNFADGGAHCQTLPRRSFHAWYSPYLVTLYHHRPAL